MSLKQIVGEIAENDTGRLKKARIHQGWWRAFVLKQEQGLRPNTKDKKICNTVLEQPNYFGNFISKEIGEFALNIAIKHNNSDVESAGIVQIDRLKNNLLSSQPLCFNFFGLLALDCDLALNVINKYFPEVTKVREFKFEYAPTPTKNYTNDNSAFDVAIEVEINESIGLIGIECKYTESFSPTEYRKPRYKELYDNSKNFKESYEVLTSSKYNQLFRNQIIAESLLQSGSYEFVKTALFCADDDKAAQETGKEFGQMLKQDLSVITFFDFIAVMQKCNLTVEQRKNTMLLWARYIGYELSQMVLDEY